MHFVYILKSEKNKSKIYIGITKNLESRIKEHNAGEEIYTKNLLPWRLETYVAFNDEKLANQFEKYLKHGSGHAFLKKRFLPKLLF